MLINFSKAIRTLSGDPILRTEGVILNLGHVCCEALVANFDDEKNICGDDKAKRYVMATKIYEQGEVDISIDDVVLLKKLIGKAFSPLVVGQAYEILDPKRPEVVKASA